jgi:hypothetical protein
MKRLSIFCLLATGLFGTGIPAFSQAANQSPIVTAQANSRSFIGLQYQDLPRGLTNLGGWVVDIGDNGKFNFSVAHVRQGTKEMLWLERFIRHDAQGRATMRVINVLELPAISKSQTLASSRFCMQNGKKNPDLIAIVEATDTEYRTQIHRAWRANRAKGKFESISTRGIVCENPGWGV